MSWQAAGNIKGQQGVPDGGGAGTSVFSRTGDVVAATGDYSFAQIRGTQVILAAIYLDTQGNLDAETPNAHARFIGTATGCQLQYYDDASASWKVAQNWP
jgi:hypothetical protein